MRNRQIKLLEQLIRIPNPSGYEEQIAKFIQEQLIEYLPKKNVTIDFQNNVIATIEGTTDKTIMIDAHSDEIGFIVNNISAEGIISINYIGGGDSTILSARDLVILTDKGKINAVVDRKHAHLVDDEDDENIYSITEAPVDIGIRKKKQVEKLVKIGDPVVYRPSFNHLVGDFYSGYGFDDKAGCFILIEAIREIVTSGKKPNANLVFVFSSQEETGATKARPLVRKYKPDMFIEVDVTFATDYLDFNGSMEREAGRCHLGKGIVIYRGCDIDKESVKALNAIAIKNKIKIQYQASTGGIGYNSTEMAGENMGVRALILGIPLRNMHTPVETINTVDLNEAVKLLKHFVQYQKLEKLL